MDHCPILMSTKHPWTDKKQAEMTFSEKNPAEQRLPGNKGDCSAAAKAEK